MHEWYVHGLEWTSKTGFTYPNEFITWTIQIVLYPYITGLVAGAFVLSSLYHLFGMESLKDMAKFALVFSFALLLGAPIPLLLHLQKPLRGPEVLLTPHFTSAISAFGFVYLAYAFIVCYEIWVVFRVFFVERSQELAKKEGIGNALMSKVYGILTLGAKDTSAKAVEKDHRAAKVLAGIGVPSACFLHGYAGFIFGSVKANALWMTPLMPVIFIMSAVISGIALCMVAYSVVMEWKKHVTKKKLQKHMKTGDTMAELRGTEVEMLRTSAKALIGFMIAAFALELLDLIFRGYTAMKSWDALRTVLLQRDFTDLFIKQYTIGYIVPFILLLWPRLTVRRAVIASLCVLFGVYMMRWNVVIGGQEASLSFAGFMTYNVPFWPHNWETFKEGYMGATVVMSLPFIFFYFINKLVPSFPPVHHKKSVQARAVGAEAVRRD